MAKDKQKKNMPDREYPASASEPSGLFSRRRPKPDEASMSGVYAGPSQPIAMMVYAGPDFFNKPGAPAPGPSRRFCPNCGFPVPSDAKFCQECGTRLPIIEQC